MKNLWTPWRIEHVRGNNPPPDHCLFEPVGHEPSSKADLLLLRNRDVVVLLNRFPYTNGHLLVAPANHVECITKLTDSETGALAQMVAAATNILKRHLNPDGFNIGCNIGATAGAGIADHLHYHIVPRWNGDNNFIAVLNEIRTIPEHLDQTFDELLPYFNSLTDDETV